MAQQQRPETPNRPEPLVNQITNELQDALYPVLSRHSSMIRSIAGCIDWTGEINSSPSVIRGFWMTPQGPPAYPDQILGSIDAARNLLTVMIGRFEDMLAAMDKLIAARAAELDKLSSAGIPTSKTPEEALAEFDLSHEHKLMMQEAAEQRRMTELLNAKNRVMSAGDSQPVEAQ